MEACVLSPFILTPGISACGRTEGSRRSGRRPISVRASDPEPGGAARHGAEDERLKPGQ